MSASTSAFGRAASCSSKEAVTLFALLLFARPDPIDLVDQPLPRIVTRIFSRTDGLLTRPPPSGPAPNLWGVRRIRGIRGRVSFLIQACLARLKQVFVIDSGWDKSLIAFQSTAPQLGSGKSGFR
jgi:hypothetical protein